MTTLRLSLREESALLRVVHDGLAAVIAADRVLIAVAERSKVGDSIDLDAASRAEFPQAYRWDYILSVPTSGKLVGLEPHSASDGEIKVVIGKKRNAQAYLRDHLRPGGAVKEWYWVTRGKVKFSRMDKASRALQQNGILFCGKQLKTLG